MSIQALRTIALSQIAVAEGATTPVPSGPGWAWSTALTKPVYWNGTIWTAGSAGGGGSPAGNSGELQYNNVGAFAGAANIEVDNGDLVLIEQASVVAPATGKVKMFCKKIANRFFPAMVGVANMDACLQPSIWRQKVGIWTPPGNATTTPGVNGFTAPTAIGTATARNVATTNLLTRTRRIGYVSAATAAAFCGQFTGAAQFTTGDGAGLGGFFYSCRFAITDAAAVSGARSFFGVTSQTTTPTNVEPSTLTNAIGIAQLSTDATQLYLVYGGSAAQTAVALGTNFPPMAGVGATNGIVYDLTIFCSPNSNGVVNVRLERVGTTFVYENTITPGTPGTQTPLNTTLLAHRAWRTNNATLLACGLDILNIYIETDY
jgi:hypothetical protein